MATIHLKIKGIEGQNPNKGYEKTILLHSYRHEFKQKVTSAARGGRRQVEGKVEWLPFVTFKRPDKSSPRLAHLCAAGKPLEQVEVIVTRTNGDNEVTRRFTMDKVFISLFRMTHDPSAKTDEGDPELEEIHFDFARIKWELTPEEDQQLQAPVVTGWDGDANGDFS